MAEQQQGGGYGGFSQPGGRSSRQENKETELVLPGLQALFRAAVDVLAAFLIGTALLLMGRWVIWGLVTLFFFSEAWDKVQDNVIGRFYGAGAGALEVGAVVVKWGWVLLGYALLRLVIPVTWTMEELLWQRSTLEPAWPLVWSMAVRGVPFRPFARMIWLIVCVVPLASWKALRDRFQWALWEFTPFGPVNVADQGIDPHKWGPVGQVNQPTQNGEMGVIFEKTDYEPHTERLGEGVYVSNGSGRSAVRIDMRWVTEEQWEAVAKLVVVDKLPFDEATLGRGRVFPTHGLFSPTHNANLGYRFFREQMLEAERVKRISNHPNAGVQLTTAGEDFLRRRFLDGNKEE